MADRSYVAANREERNRLEALLARLSDQELGRPLEAGWTIAAVLGHLAFWDQRILVLIEQWRKGGAAAIPKQLDESSVDWINDATKPMLLAVPPRRAAELMMSIANAVDATVDALPEELVSRNTAAGNPVNLLRATHRREHREEIERALGK